MIGVLAVTVAVFVASVTDPNRATPLSAVVYTASVCGLARFVEVVPITNPTAAYYPDPADPTMDCRVDVRAQLATVADGTGYRAAVKHDGAPYGLLSTPFALVSAVVVSSICETDPLRLTNIKWPTKATGAGASLTFTARNRTSLQPWVSFAFVWPGRLTVTDTRGCVHTEMK